MGSLIWTDWSGPVSATRASKDRGLVVDRDEQAVKAAGRLATRRRTPGQGECPDCGCPTASEPVPEIGEYVRHCARCGWDNYAERELDHLRGLAPECHP